MVTLVLARSFPRNTVPDVDDADRAHLVALADVLVGRSLRRHEWPWLRNDDGEPVVVDAFWPDLAVALSIATEPFGPWKLTGAMLRLRGIRLVVVPPSALPWAEDGRLVRDDRRLLEILAARELPRDEWEDPDDGRPQRLGDHERPSSADLVESDWELSTLNGDRLSWDDAVDDWPTPTEPTVATSWRGSSVLLAALGAAVLGRTIVEDSVRGDLSAPQLQVLAALIAEGRPEFDDTVGAQHDTPAALAARLELPVEVVRGAVESLRDAGLVGLLPDEPSRVWPTRDGEAKIDEWLARIAPRFGRWPARNPDADDAG